MTVGNALIDMYKEMQEELGFREHTKDTKLTPKNEHSNLYKKCEWFLRHHIDNLDHFNCMFCFCP